MIVDKFPRAVEGTPVPLRSTGDSSTAKARTETKAGSKAKPGQRRPAVSEAECTA
jgi:putative transposase